MKKLKVALMIICFLLITVLLVFAGEKDAQKRGGIVPTALDPGCSIRTCVRGCSYTGNGYRCYTKAVGVRYSSTGIPLRLSVKAHCECTVIIIGSASCKKTVTRTGYGRVSTSAYCRINKFGPLVGPCYTSKSYCSCSD
ncbi:hypothetical protein ES705_41587 [subsurface metagenome]|jgi:hypothetical protein